MRIFWLVSISGGGDKGQIFVYPVVVRTETAKIVM